MFKNLRLTKVFALFMAIALFVTLAACQNTDKDAAKEVDDLIAALPSAVILEDEDCIAAINAAQTAYAALSNIQRGYVTKHADLIARLAELEDLRDNAAADKVMEKINALPSSITLINKSAVVSARNDYAALTAAQRALVINYNILLDAEFEIAELEKVVDVIAKIDAIPAIDMITPSNSALIEAVRAAYEALTDIQKDEITNYAKLVASEAALVVIYVYPMLEAAEMGDEVEIDGITYYYHENIFATIAEAQAAIIEGGRIYLLAGTYSEDITINKSFTLRGPNFGVSGHSEGRIAEAVFTGTITIAANNVTIDGLAFTGVGRIANSGFLNNLTFKNNNVYDIYYTSELAFFYLSASEDKYHDNIQILNNRLSNIGGTNSNIRPIFIMNGNNITIDNNIIDTFNRDILFSGTNGLGLSNGSSGGLSGDFIFTNNTVKNAGYRALHVTRHMTTSMTIHSNIIDNVENAAITIYGYDINSVSETTISIKFNVITKALNGIYVDPEMVTDFSKFTLYIEYNALYDFKEGLPRLYHFYSFASMEFCNPKHNYYGDGFNIETDFKLDDGFKVTDTYATLEELNEGIAKLPK